MITIKTTLGIAAAVCLTTLSAAELLAPKTAKDFTKADKIQEKDGALTFKMRDCSIISLKGVPVDPAKKYKLSGEIKLAGGTPANFFIGLVCYNDKGKEIHTCYFLEQTKGTLTELAAPVKKTDTVVKVKDASKWNNKIPYGHVAFNAKKDFSDLPNFEIANYLKGGIVKNGNVWEIKLKKPIGKDYPAGTIVRAHTDGSSFLYAAGIITLSEKWTPVQGIVTGNSKNEQIISKFRPGTKSVKLIFSGYGGNGTAVVSVKNVKFEEVK